MRLGADLRSRGRDSAAQAPRARRRPGPGAPRLGVLPDRAGGGRRPCGDRPHQRRRAVRRHRAPLDRRRGRGGGRADAAPAFRGLGRVRDPVRGAPGRRELELLRHRPDAVQPRCGYVDEQRVRARAPWGRAGGRRARAVVRAVSRRLLVGVLGASGSWHTRGLLAALSARGHDTLAIPATRLQSEVNDHGGVHVLGPDGAVLDELDLLLVRGLPRGSLEQVIFRVDALHVLAAHGVRCVNSPRALERTVDKAWAGAVLAGAGLPTPPTIVCERYEAAMGAFERLGGDAVVTPLFGAMGNGLVRT